MSNISETTHFATAKAHSVNRNDSLRLANAIDDATEQVVGYRHLARMNGDETTHFAGGHRDGMRHFMGGANV